MQGAGNKFPGSYDAVIFHDSGTTLSSFSVDIFGLMPNHVVKREGWVSLGRLPPGSRTESVGEVLDLGGGPRASIVKVRAHLGSQGLHPVTQERPTVSTPREEVTNRSPK
ncbi:unnamed protein product [Calypogeia fissa]